MRISDWISDVCSSDLVVDTAGEEQIDLISRAIESDHAAKNPGALAPSIAVFARRDRPREDASRLASMLEACLSLHPSVAAFLGPISRRCFAQNQRSIFAFLNSSELHAFQDFLTQARKSTRLNCST